MNDPLAIAVHNTVFALAVAVPVYGLSRIWRNPPVIYLLWVVVLLKLVAPPALQFDWPMFPQLDSTPDHEQIIGDLPEPSEPSNAAYTNTVDQSQIRSTANTPAMIAQPTNAKNDDNTFWLRLRPILFSVWIGGAIIWALMTTIRIVRFERLLRGTLPASERLRGLTRDVAGKLGLQRVPDIRLAERIEVPLVWCAVRRPIVVLPMRLFRQFDDQQTAMILAHELAHLRRRDHWVRGVELMVSIVHWWNPLAWLIRRQLHQAEDLCCDAWVRRMFPDCARRYAELLLKVAETIHQPRFVSRLLPACRFLNSFSLKARIEMMLQNQFEPCVSKRSMFAVALTTCLVVPLFFGKSEPKLWAAPNQETAGTPTAADAAVKSEFPYAVKFEQGATAFYDGDKITVDEVRGTAETFEPGNIYFIKGTYTLASHDKATLAAYTTAMDAENAKGYSFKAQTMVVDQKQGKFTLFLPMSCRGWPHVTFYPAGGGSDFGGNYIGTGESTLKKWWGTNEKDRKLSAAATESNRANWPLANKQSTTHFWPHTGDQVTKAKKRRRFSSS